MRRVPALKNRGGMHLDGFFVLMRNYHSNFGRFVTFEEIPPNRGQYPTDARKMGTLPLAHSFPAYRVTGVPSVSKTSANLLVVKMELPLHER